MNPLKPPYISFSRSGAGRSCGCAPAQVTPSTRGRWGHSASLRSRLYARLSRLHEEPLQDHEMALQIQNGSAGENNANSPELRNAIARVRASRLFLLRQAPFDQTKRLIFSRLYGGDIRWCERPTHLPRPALAEPDHVVAHPLEVRLGPGRTVASETKAPIILDKTGRKGMRGGAKRECDRRALGSPCRAR